MTYWSADPEEFTSLISQNLLIDWLRDQRGHLVLAPHINCWRAQRFSWVEVSHDFEEVQWVERSHFARNNRPWLMILERSWGYSGCCCTRNPVCCVATNRVWFLSSSQSCRLPPYVQPAQCRETRAGCKKNQDWWMLIKVIRMLVSGDDVFLWSLQNWRCYSLELDSHFSCGHFKAFWVTISQFWEQQIERRASHIHVHLHWSLQKLTLHFQTLENGLFLHEASIPFSVDRKWFLDTISTVADN